MSGGRTKTEKRKMKISEARPLLEEAESERLINQDTVSSCCVQNTYIATALVADMLSAPAYGLSM